MSMASERPHFFQILSSIDSLVKLPIPRAFARSFLKNFCEHRKATLVTPLGKLWHVGIVKNGDRLYLNNGWQEFALAYELDRGGAVLFEYKGNMIFDLKIFSSAGCSIDYKNVPKKITAQETTDAESHSSEDLTSNQSETTREKNEKKEKPIAKKSKAALVNQTKYSKMNELKQLERTVTAHNITSGSILIPTPFCSSTGILSKSHVLLVDSGGRQWSVKIYESHGIFLGRGWISFVKANNLEEGDKCIFRYVYGRVLQVEIAKKAAVFSKTKTMVGN